MASKDAAGQLGCILVANKNPGAVRDLGDWYRRHTSLAAERVLIYGGATEKFAFAINQQNANTRFGLEPEKWLQIMMESSNTHRNNMLSGKQALTIEKHLRLSLCRIRLARSYVSSTQVDGVR